MAESQLIQGARAVGDDAELQRSAQVEWPTLALFGAIYATFFVLTLFHAAIPLWLWLPLAAWTSAWWGSAQHEALHGHPTRSRRLNAALATPPFWLWLPYARYRETHLAHHRDERLTDPLDDPESRYWTSGGWRGLGTLGQKLVAWQATLSGRLLIGPLWSIGHFLIEDTRAVIGGNRRRARIWALHLVWVALLMMWIIAICGLPLWLYLIGFVYGGAALALIRSFAEHRAHDDVDKRTAIVESSAILGLLFLNNNLHVAHHRWPSVAWYRLPALYRARREDLLAANGGLVYAGYRDVFRRFLFRAHDAPLHPSERAPHREERKTIHAGIG